MGGEFTYQPKWDPKTVLTTAAICRMALSAEDFYSQRYALGGVVRCDEESDEALRCTKRRRRAVVKMGVGHMVITNASTLGRMNTHVPPILRGTGC